MDNFLPHITRIASKLQLLLKQQEAMTKELAKLRQSLDQKDVELAALKELVATLTEQNAILKTGSQQMPATERKAFERKINQYIKDVEKAIVQLSA
jgi:signal recognition particle GTPase